MDAAIRDQMHADLLTAMRARDSVRVSVLRSTLAAVANAEAVDPTETDRRISEVARKHLTESEIRAIITAEHDDLRSASSEMASLGLAAKAEELSMQAQVLASYLNRRVVLGGRGGFGVWRG